MIKVTEKGVEYIQETKKQKRLREALECLNLPSQHKLIIEKMVDDCMIEAVMIGAHGAQDTQRDDLKKVAASDSRAKFFELLADGIKK